MTGITTFFLIGLFSAMFGGFIAFTLATVRPASFENLLVSGFDLALETGRWVVFQFWRLAESAGAAALYGLGRLGTGFIEGARWLLERWPTNRLLKEIPLGELISHTAEKNEVNREAD